MFWLHTLHNGPRSRGARGKRAPSISSNFKELVRKSVLCPPNIESLMCPPPPTPQISKLLRGPCAHIYVVAAFTNLSYSFSVGLLWTVSFLLKKNFSSSWRSSFTLFNTSSAITVKEDVVTSRPWCLAPGQSGQFRLLVGSTKDGTAGCSYNVYKCW